MKFVGPLTSGIAGRHCIIISKIEKKARCDGRQTDGRTDGHGDLKVAMPATINEEEVEKKGRKKRRNRK